MTSINIADLIRSPEFVQLVGEHLINLRKSKDARPVPEQGTRYRRGWIDRMESERIYNPEFFASQFILIIQKKSDVSAEFRNIIKVICTEQLNKLIKKIKDEEGKEGS